ncbi:MAG: CHAT domain-containing protein, partial [Oscillochloridaceae bacterium umkhey_bin13]
AIHDLRNQLSANYGTNWSLLCPLFTSDGLLLLGLTPETSFCTHQPLDPALRDLIAQATLPQQRQLTYRDLRRLRDPRQPDWQSLTQLGAALIPPWLQRRLHPQHRLFVIPSGPLHSLAWAALRVNGHWLCEQAILAYRPQLHGETTSGRLATQSPALLFGCSQFGTRAPALPVAAATLDLVARHWPGPSSQWHDSEASWANLERLHATDQLGQYGLIHLASHAQLGGADGLLAQISLADGDLLLDTISQLRLNADLVVLSACEGAAGAVLPGDEVLSLNRALLAAGARMVLASLWTVYDQGVLALLEPFYVNLSRHGDAALALAEAQRSVLAQPAPPTSLVSTPYLWGGFMLLMG